MSVAIYIACESDIEGEDTFVDGKALGHVDPEVLEAVEKNLPCKGIYDFMSASADEFAEFMDDVDDAEMADEVWHTAEQGLETVRLLRDYLRANPDSVPSAADVIEDLDDFERVLQLLESSGIGFHFAMDY